MISGRRSRSGGTSRKPEGAATRVLPVAGSHPERHPAVLEGGEILRAGGLVAFPTETVYGLGADATSAPAVEAIFQAKGRPADNPVIVHVAAIDEVEAVGRVDDPRVRRLLRRFWPGPLTVVIPARGPVREAACRGLETVAVRMPAHPVALALIRAASRPIAAPSANLSGRPSPTTAEHVLEDLDGRVPLILDGGPCQVGIESTVLDLTGTEASVLRPGAVTAEQIAAELAADVTVGGGEALARSPGTRYRHYRPHAAVVVIHPEVSADAVRHLVGGLRSHMHMPFIGYITTRGVPPASMAGLQVVDRTSPGSLVKHLYADFRSLDREEAGLIFVEAVARDEPVMDRLHRAASCVLSSSDFEAPEQLLRRIMSLVPSS